MSGDVLHDTAGTVILGASIAGDSVAPHLARMGWDDIVPTPLGVLAAVHVLLPGPVSSLGTGLLTVVGGLLGLAVVAVAALARVPVVTCLQDYALLVLGDIEESLDPIPGRRTVIRVVGGEPAGA